MTTALGHVGAYNFAQSRSIELELAEAKKYARIKPIERYSSNVHDKYEENYKQFESMLNDGIKMNAIADELGLSVTTLYSKRYLGRYNGK